MMKDGRRAVKADSIILHKDKGAHDPIPSE